jgi:cytochrome c oxidase subunit 3
MNQQPFTPAEERDRGIRARRMITWLIVFAITMFFAGLISAYLVSMSGGYWTRIALPVPFLWSTALVLAGSLAIQLAVMAARSGRPKQVAPLVLLTLVMGVGFGASQWKGWSQLVSIGITWSPNKVLALGGEYGRDFTLAKDGIPLVAHGGHWYTADDTERQAPLDAEIAEQRDRSGPFLYTLTIAHAAHVGFGLLSLFVMALMALRQRYTPENHVGLWAGAIYWHFLGGLWVILLLFLNYVH